MDAEVHHHLVGLGVGVDVELRDRGGVAGAEAAGAHGPDALELFHGLRGLHHGESHVGDGTDDRQLHLAGVLLHQADDGIRRVDAFHGLQFGMDEAAVAHAVVPVDVAGVDGSAHQGPVRALVNRGRGRQVRDLHAHEAVEGGLLHRHIAADGGEGQDLVPQLAQAHDDGDGIIRAGIRIDDELPHERITPFLSYSALV